MLFPVPFLQEFLRERISIGVTLGVETTSRVAIPIPGAAHSTTVLEDPHREPELTQTVQLIQPGNPGADDDHVKLLELKKATNGWSMKTAGGSHGQDRTLFSYPDLESVCAGERPNSIGDIIWQLISLLICRSVFGFTLTSRHRRNTGGIIAFTTGTLR